MVAYMELHHAARNKGTGTMNISRNIAIALVGLSIGFSATSANAGILGDIAGRVTDKVMERSQTQPTQQTAARKGGFASGLFYNPGYTSCVERVTNAVTPSERARLKNEISSQCAEKNPLWR